MEPIDPILRQYGGDPDAFRRFDGDDGPELLPYASLLAGRVSASDQPLSSLLGVYEWQNAPLVFLVNGDDLAENGLSRLRRSLAMRGDAPYLGVVRAGQLTIYRISLDADTPDQSRIPTSGSVDFTLPWLANGRPGLDHRGQRWISDVVLQLLRDSIAEVRNCGVEDQDAVSLVGRALFARFLGDRGLLANSLQALGTEEISSLFDAPEQARRTCTWLDETFNGDLLPISANLLSSLSADAYWSLGNILRRSPDGQFSLQWEEKWANLEFANIPVGVLSQAHEQYLKEYLPSQQRKEGCYYTPRSIASMMVRGSFHELRREGRAHIARVLDPASGAGVFLITAYRQLVAERWRHDGVRPNTSTLREILYSQISGFDINESALRFSALGLYLMAIELDDDPEPVQKLGFEKLREKVLHKVGHAEGDAAGRTLGSLGDIDESHVGKYDLVVGNPPWTSGTKLPNWNRVLEMVARVARSRNPNAPAPRLPNEVLDLPFVWRAMEWARPGAQIAFALHGRLLFQQREGMRAARAEIFEALDVTGVINGAELRQTKVWPEISAPFCILFARNATPAPGAQFRFVSPHLEDRLNRAGGLRIDAGNADTVGVCQVTSVPQLLKILFRGTELDLRVYEQVKAHGLSRLGDFWKKNGTVSKIGEGRHWMTRNGYPLARKSSTIDKNGERGVSAKYLWDLPELAPSAMRSVVVDAGRLIPFRHDRLNRRRPRELFIGPKFIVQKSPPVRAGRIRAVVADMDVVFSESYYGYGFGEDNDARLHARYFALIVGSKFSLWHALMSSGEFGFEREVIEKFVIDELPVRHLNDLSPEQREDIEPLFAAVARDDSESAWAEVDAWVASLYGLRERDLQVISDTLAFSLPFAANRQAAQRYPGGTEVDDFCHALSSDLNTIARLVEKKIVAVSPDVATVSPWKLVRISTEPQGEEPPNEDWREILRVADRSAATEVVYPVPAKNCIWVARLAQARYWSRSQARLVAQRIAWEHMDALLGGDL